MSIIDILEAHLFVPGGFVDPGNHCSCGNYYNNEYVAGKIQLDEHLAHVAQALEQHEQEAKAEAVRETSRYIQRIFPRMGLVDRADILADIEIAADRIGRGIHANGRDRKTS